MMSQTGNSHYLSIEERTYIVTLHNELFSYSQIIEKFKSKYKKKIYNSTINGICSKEKAMGSVEDLPKSGRPPIYNERETRNIVRASLKDRSASIRDISENPEINPKEASYGTVRNVLLSHRVVSRVLPKRMADLTSKHIAERKRFADEHLNWDAFDWELVIFSDEADLFPTKCGKEYIRLREGESLVDVVPVKDVAQKPITVKVWGTISSNGVGTLVRYNNTMNSLKYRDTLNEYLFQDYPMLLNSRMEEEDSPDQLPSFIFMQDKSSSHTAKIIRRWGDENEVNLMKWPSNSPDLNIIENVWAYVQDRLYDVREQLNSPEDIWQKALEIWTNIPLSYIQDLYNDLPLRMKELKNMKGGPIPH